MNKIDNGVMFIFQQSSGNMKWAIEKYALQMVRELKKINIDCNIIPLVGNLGVFKNFIINLLRPLIVGWKLLFCKEKIIYIHYDFFVFYILWLPFLFLSKVIFHKKIILQIHEYWGNLPYKKIIKIVDLLYCSIANRIIIHNNVQLKVLEQYGFKNIDFLHMPIDNYLTSTNNISINDDNINILMHGAIIRKKGYEIGISALITLPEKYTLTLIGGVGDSIYFNELLNLIKQYKLESRVSIINKFLPENEYEEYIINSDLIIYPYLISTASAALSEGALKFEKPFLTSNLESFIDYLGNTDYTFKTGNYNNLSDNILNINFIDAVKFSINLKNNYNWNKVGLKLLNIFNKI